jgi:multiphosphoryl transfer protein
VKEFEVVINNPTGLHARPAKVFVNTAKQFTCDIRVHHGERKANAKSLISVLTLGAERGAQVRITAAGDDEDEAIAVLADAIASGLGEEVTQEQPAAVAVPAAGDGAAPTPAPEPPPAPAPAKPATQEAGSSAVVNGIGAAPGIAIGPIFQLRAQTLTVDETSFAGAEAEGERLQRALAAAQEELGQVAARLGEQAPEEAAIFEVHAEILDDPDLLEAVHDQIGQGNNAPRAWQQAIEQRAAQVAALKDALLAERAADLRDVGQRVLRLLVGAEDGARLPAEPAIVVAHDLTPSDTAALSGLKVLGFCTAAGGPTAHAAIIARALRLPAVVSAGDGVLSLAEGTIAILDGSAGTLAVSPGEGALAMARARQKHWQQTQDAAATSASQPAVTADGHHVEVVANIGGLDDARTAATSGAEGVGLLRTEFLFLGRPTAPTEDEQAGVYRDIVAALEQRPVIVRTLDIGGDKPLPYIEVPPEANPFLGERGIRLCLNRPELLRQQVRAILRAAEAGPVRIMFPMIADVGEWRRARQIVEEERAALGAPPVEMGIMIEIPSAALMADHFAAEVDFFSVGTNDLTQYTLAMDRMHPTLAAQSDGLHPAVLRLIARTVDAAHEQGKWVGICGELGADPVAVPILVGLGVDELSVSVPAVAAVKAQIRELKLDDAQRLAQRALACATANEVRALIG